MSQRPRGDYLVNPSNFSARALKGLKLATTLEEPVTLPIGNMTQFYLRHPSAVKYQCLALYAGIGVDVEAGRRAGFMCKFGAESNPERARKFYTNTGVVAATSNENLLRDGVPDVPVWTFGFECTSVSPAGLGEGRDHDSWPAVCTVIERLAKHRPLSFRIENVKGLLTNSNGDMMAELLDKLRRAGYLCIYGVANPKDFGVAVDRPRLYILGFLEEEAKAVGVDTMKIPSCPFKTGDVKLACVSDTILRRKDISHVSDALVFNDYAKQQRDTCGDEWEIVWKTNYNSDAKRKALRRGKTASLRKAVAMGHVRIRGTAINTRTGFKIYSSYGLLPGLTNTDRAEGPGRNTCFFYDHPSKTVRTLDTREIKQLWECEGLEATIADLGLTAHPVTTTAVSLLQAMVLDKIYALSRSCPRLPALEVDCLEDLLSEHGMMWLAGPKFGELALEARRSFLKGEKCHREPIRLGNRVFKNPMLAMWNWDLRRKIPQRISWGGAPSQVIDLRSMPADAARTDEGIVEGSRLLGMAGVSNPTEVSTLRVNGKSWYGIEEKALAEMKALGDRGDWEFFERPPFVPLHFNTLFAVQQGEKHRTIFNKSAGGELSLNGQAQDCGMAKLKLISLDSICQAIATLQAKVLRMRSWGWNVGLSLSWVDFWAAFNQTGIAPPEIWQNVAGFVRLGSSNEPEYVYAVTDKSQFGGYRTPFEFCRISGTTTRGCAILLREATGYTLQTAWREELGRRVDEPSPPPLVPRQATGRQRPWSERCPETTPEPLAGSFSQWPWNHVGKESGLTSDEPRRTQEACFAPIEEGDLSALLNYLDDTLHIPIVPLERVTGEDGNEYDFADGRESTVGSGEYLRLNYITRPLEACNIVIKKDARSVKKYKEGKSSQIQIALGFLFDFSDPECPRVSLRPQKADEYLTLVQSLAKEMEGSKTVSYKTLEGVAHRLSYASQVVQRGRIYTSGLHAALGMSKDKRSAFVTGWMQRNVKFWLRFFTEGPPPVRLILNPPNLSREESPFTDASTSWGCGGFFCSSGTCYWFMEEWTPEERNLIEITKDEGGIGINYLELVTVLFLLEASGTRLDGKSFSFYIDNQVSVDVLLSSRARQAKMSLVLELIDVVMTRRQHNVYWDWIDTISNHLSDCLSRNALDEFMRDLVSTYGEHNFVQIEVPPHTRDISALVKRATENIELLRLL